MPNWWATREQVKTAVSLTGSDKDSQIDRIIEAVSRRIERETRRFYIPRTETRLYRWPTPNGQNNVLWLDQDLLSITTLKSEAQNSSPTTIVAADYFLEPNNTPPYNRIEIDLSSASSLQSGDTSQRSISVLGSWGYDDETATAGTVASGLASDAAAVSMVGSNGSLIDVGHTLLIGTEQIFVSERSFAAKGSVLVDDAGITADKADVTITLDASHGVLQNETIRLDAEQMYVTGISGNVATVIRAYNGTVLATHANDTAVHINRTFTIVRGINGTTAAVHADNVAVSKYVPVGDIAMLTIAEAIAAYAQETGGWGRMVGTGEGQREFSGRDLARLRKDTIDQYRRLRMATI